MPSDGPGSEDDIRRRIKMRTQDAVEKLRQIRAEAKITRFPPTDGLLLRHALILGASGSGKTNHAFHVIRESIAMRPKSCFIIDTKREYRKLDGLVQEQVQVLAVGDEPTIRYNPLIPPPNTSPDQWDRTFADVFVRAYGLSEPSRRIMLDCLWSLRQRARVSPTLRELEQEVGEFEAGSNKEQASKRSLESRLHNVNNGAVGTSINSELQLDIPRMDGKVTILEVGKVASLRDQRFLAELMLAQLWHCDVAAAIEDEKEEKLRRLIVVEEAHRYLSEERPPQQRGDRTLLELAIAEARRYGWGFLIIDQMPSLLSKYVWDNSGTVMAHRLSNLDSYEVVEKAIGNNLFPVRSNDPGELPALKLPEEIAMFRRYLSSEEIAMSTGFTQVPRVTKAQ